MRTTGGNVLISASDLTRSAECEWATVRQIDQLLGHQIDVPRATDSMLERAAELGVVHEQRLLAEFDAEFPGQVVRIAMPLETEDVSWHAAATAAAADTLHALQTGAPVIYQAAFLDDGFVGFADFVVRTETGAYRVIDTKLARSAKPAALIQAASYTAQIAALGFETDDSVELVLGTNEHVLHPLRDVAPVARARREQLRVLIAQRQSSQVAGAPAIAWGDDSVGACGSCAACEVEVAAHDDVFQVAGIRGAQRAKLRAAGIATLADLADTARTELDGMAQATFTALVQQARAQVRTRRNQTKLGEGATAKPFVEVKDEGALARVPEPNPGDLFFDFEGDPLYSEGDRWNLDYLFGFVDTDAQFTALWAHSLDEERTAFLAFIADVERRRVEQPGLHIYHYAAYERTHLAQLALRHGVGEAFVEDLFDANVLVDLYPIVRAALTVGSPSYSLKKLEPLYMGDDEREGVSNAIDSVAEYAVYTELVAAGRPDEAAEKLADIARYNEYDCRSTLQLRDWLLKLACEAGVQPDGSTRVLSKEERAERAALEAEEDEGDGPRDPNEPGISPAVAAARALKTELRERRAAVKALLDEDLLGISGENRTPDQQAVAMALAVLEFYPREKKSQYWEAFNRQIAPVEDWESNRNVFMVNELEVIEDWHATARSTRRILRAVVTPAPGSHVDPGDSIRLLYRDWTDGLPETDLGLRPQTNGTIQRVVEPGVIELSETTKIPGVLHSEVPLAIVPSGPLDTAYQEQAVSMWAESVVRAYVTGGSLPENAATDIIRRIAPRLGELPIVSERNFVSSIRDALLAIDHSYLAVQGPPGAGKSFNGGNVIADLVMNHGWRVGIVAQSHATIENLLRKVAEHNVPKKSMFKKIAGKQSVRALDAQGVPWTPTSQAPTSQMRSVDGGVVVGGTAWDFSREDRFDEQELDLIVIDEAGQFSLANTIAVSRAAQRLLLLGDPQQLPQVSQGVHPEPVDESALGWLIGDDEVIAVDRGYFLDQSWRMHERVCAVVSQLSYAGKLTSAAPERELSEQQPGFFAVPVEHSENSTESAEEAEAIVSKVRELWGRTWFDGKRTQPLASADENIIVVAAYNAQVQRIRAALDAAGFPNVRVGTVDKFQGQEAAVALVSLAASSAADVPRGLEFLLMPNRLNVAISRAKWAAFMFYSPRLIEYVPKTVPQLTLMSRFINLVQPVG